MKKFLAALTAISMLTAAIPAAVTAAAEDSVLTDADYQFNPRDFAWFPDNKDMFLKEDGSYSIPFLEDYGNLSVHDGYIVFCAEEDDSKWILDASASSAEYNIVYDDYLYPPMIDIDPDYTGSLPSYPTYRVMVVQPRTSGILKLNWSSDSETSETFSGSFTIADDLSVADAEQPSFPYPQTYQEAEQFVEQYGNISIQGDYVVLCVDESTSGMCYWVLKTEDSTAEFEEYCNTILSLSDAPGDPWYRLIVLKPTSSGVLHLNWELMDYDWEYQEDAAPKDVVSASFTIADDLSISEFSENTTETDAVHSGLYRGDVTGDGIVDLRDIIMMTKYLHGMSLLDNPAEGDFNRDGVIDIFDLGGMKRFVLEYTSVPDTLTEETIPDLKFGQLKKLLEMVESGELANEPCIYELPETLEPLDELRKFTYRADDGNFARKSAETQEEAQALAEGFFTPENDSYNYSNFREYYIDSRFWIYAADYSNNKVEGKPVGVILFNKEWYDDAENRLCFELTEENIIEFLSIYFCGNNISGNLANFYTETEDEIHYTCYNIGINAAADWGIDHALTVRKTEYVIDKHTSTWKQTASNQDVISYSIPGTAWDAFENR